MLRLCEPLANPVAHAAVDHRRLEAIMRLSTCCRRATLAVALAASISGAVPSIALADVPPIPRAGGEISTADITGISDALAFILSEHFPDLSGYPEFGVAMRGPDRCARISPLPCD
jgi:hypothetical protein